MARAEPPPLALSGAPGAVYTAVGEGTGSRENWTASRRTHKAFDIEQWILGFLAGVGFDTVDGTDPLKLLGSGVVFLWIRITNATVAALIRS
jgi:opacity protein-like surface antigen